MNSDRLYRAFADPTRRRALRLLGLRKLCVCDLTEALRLPQPTVSRHLGTLHRAGLVRVEKKGKWRHYELLLKTDELGRSLLASLTAENDANGDVKRLKALPERSCES